VIATRLSRLAFVWVSFNVQRGEGEPIQRTTDQVRETLSPLSEPGPELCVICARAFARIMPRKDATILPGQAQTGAFVRRG
jgi:hypothetical protein